MPKRLFRYYQIGNSSDVWDEIPVEISPHFTRIFAAEVAAPVDSHWNATRSVEYWEVRDGRSELDGSSLGYVVCEHWQTTKNKGEGGVEDQRRLVSRWRTLDLALQHLADEPKMVDRVDHAGAAEVAIDTPCAEGDKHAQVA